MTFDESGVKIPIIPYGLRQEETIVQIAVALDNINSIATDVFEQIESNIKRHKEYLATIQKRSVVLQTKIDKLAGKNVTITLYSPHKFPIEDYHADTLFKMNFKPLKKKIDVSIENKFQHAKYNKIPNKLQFFHVTSTKTSKKSSAGFEHGLGSLPPDINHLDSLFLFNTSQNVYEKYVMLDPLSVSINKSRSEETEKSDIAAAPNSIINNEMYRNENYFTGFYRPAFEEVPSIDVPLDLPDLPGIADDLSFSAVVNTSVMPFKQQLVDNKPKSIDEITIADLPIISQPKMQGLPSQETSQSCAANNNTLLTTSASPLPPPPQHSLSASVPPPPPPPLPADENSANTATQNRLVNTVTPSDNIHAALMEAIRKAGGKEKAQLKQVDRLKMQAVSSDNDNKSIFVDDLYAALTRRRKGISGQNKDKEKVSIMDRVSAMIPHASEDESDNSIEDDTNDWED